MVITVLHGRIHVDTKDECLLCQRKRKAPSTRNCEGNRKSVSVKVLMRYLEVQVWKLTNLPASSPSNQCVPVDNPGGDVLISVCTICDGLLERFSKFYNEFEVARMKLEGVTKDLVKVMTVGGARRTECRRNTRRPNPGSPEGVDSLGLADKIREETLRKCRDKVETSMPRVALRRKQDNPCENQLELNGNIRLPPPPPTLHNLANSHGISASEAANDSFETLHTNAAREPTDTSPVLGIQTSFTPVVPSSCLLPPTNLDDKSCMNSDDKTAASASSVASATSIQLELCFSEAPIVLTEHELSKPRDKADANAEKKVSNADADIEEAFSSTIMIVTEEELLESGRQPQVGIDLEAQSVTCSIPEQFDDLEETTEIVGGLCSFCGRQFTATLCEHGSGSDQDSGHNEIEENVMEESLNRGEVHNEECVDEKAEGNLSSNSVTMAEPSNQVEDNEKAVIGIGSDKENHTCLTCGYKFASVRGLSKHQRTHARATYEEGAEPSPKKRKRSGSEVRHLAVSPSNCSNDNSQIHWKKQPDDRLHFGCSFCEKTFVKLEHYHHHQLALHPIEFLGGELPPGTTKKELDKVMKGILSTCERCGETKKFRCPDCVCMRAGAYNIKLHILKAHLSRVVSILEEMMATQEDNAEAEVRNTSDACVEEDYDDIWVMEGDTSARATEEMENCARASTKNGEERVINPYSIYDDDDDD